jgi:hypothetical protein
MLEKQSKLRTTLTRRRGVMGAALALGGVFLGKLATPERVEATSGTSPEGNMILGANSTTGGRSANTATDTTEIIATGGGTNGGLKVNNSTGDGVVGISTNGAGLHGIGIGASSSGLSGDSTAGVGVLGNSTNNHGLLGFSSGNLTYGLNGSGFNNAHGVIGASTNQNGIIGLNLNGNNWAATFINVGGTQGVFVQGDLVVTGMKSSAYKTQRNGSRRLYAVEAAECWFEDFGRAKLVKGTARVDLDDVFSETVNTKRDYIVSLTPLDAASKGLAVVAQDERGFTVQELSDGTGNYAFTYRVSAKVKGEEGRRLQQVSIPQVPDLPKPPGRSKFQ